MWDVKLRVRRVTSFANDGNLVTPIISSQVQTTVTVVCTCDEIIEVTRFPSTCAVE